VVRLCQRATPDRRRDAWFRCWLPACVAAEWQQVRTILRFGRGMRTCASSCRHHGFAALRYFTIPLLVFCACRTTCHLRYALRCLHLSGAVSWFSFCCWLRAACALPHPFLPAPLSSSSLVAFAATPAALRLRVGFGTVAPRLTVCPTISTTITPNTTLLPPSFFLPFAASEDVCSTENGKGRKRSHVRLLPVRVVRIRGTGVVR